MLDKLNIFQLINIARDLECLAMITPFYNHDNTEKLGYLVGSLGYGGFFKETYKDALVKSIKMKLKIKEVQND